MEEGTRDPLAHTLLVVLGDGLAGDVVEDLLPSSMALVSSVDVPFFSIRPDFDFDFAAFLGLAILALLLTKFVGR